MTDLVFIHGLQVDTVIGVNPRERKIRQTLLIDVDLYTDLSAAGQTDNLAATLDYAAISSSVADTAARSSFLLIEALAEHLCDLILQDHRINKVAIKVTKPGAVSMANAVGCSLLRQRKAADD